MKSGIFAGARDLSNCALMCVEVEELEEELIQFKKIDLEAAEEERQQTAVEEVETEATSE